MSLSHFLQVILSELYSTGFKRSFSDDDDLTAIADSDVIYAFQAPPLYSRGGSAPHSGIHSSRMSIKNAVNTWLPTFIWQLLLIPRFQFFSSSLPLLFWLTFTHTYTSSHSGGPYNSLTTAFFSQADILLSWGEGSASAMCFVFLLSFFYAW